MPRRRAAVNVGTIAVHRARENGLASVRSARERAEAIIMETRVITISDIFDAITADRPYRKAIPLAQALEIMKKALGSAIDPDCLDPLHACLPKPIEAAQVVL
jgi:HD-GYP domain-containing protein (c-di-GMP phosphodiesterase class II)